MSSGYSFSVRFWYFQKFATPDDGTSLQLARLGAGWIAGCRVVRASVQLEAELVHAPQHIKRCALNVLEHRYSLPGYAANNIIV